MRHKLVLLVAAMSIAVATTGPVTAEAPGAPQLIYATYEFDWVVDLFQVYDTGYPNVPDIAVGDVGTGSFTIANWTNGVPDGCVYWYWNPPGLRLSLETGGYGWDAIGELARVYNDCGVATVNDALTLHGWTGTPDYSGLVLVTLSALTADVWSSNEIPTQLDLDDFDWTGAGLVWWDRSNNPTAPWLLGAAITSLNVIGPEALLEQLIEFVDALNLQSGISNSLDAKLQNAVNALDDVNENNNVAAANKLEAFINEVEAQAGNKIPIEDAEVLIALAQQIIELLT